MNLVNSTLILPDCLFDPFRPSRGHDVGLADDTGSGSYERRLDETVLARVPSSAQGNRIAPHQPSRAH